MRYVVRVVGLSFFDGGKKIFPGQSQQELHKSALFLKNHAETSLIYVHENEESAEANRYRPKKKLACSV